VELGYNGAPPRYAEAFADGLRSLVVQPVWLHALDETARIEGGGPSPLRRQRQSSSIRETTIPFEGPTRQKPINSPLSLPLAPALYPIPLYLSAPFLFRLKTTSAGPFWIHLSQHIKHQFSPRIVSSMESFLRQSSAIARSSRYFSLS
jgi:hypothetical protein